MTSGDDRNRAIDRVSREVDRLAGLTREVVSLSDIERATDWRRIEDRLRGTAERAPRWRWFALAAVVATVIPILLIMHRPAADPLTLVVSGGSLAEGQVSARADAPATLRFSDGTEVALQHGASGRVREIGPHGASIQLERGRARVRVVPLVGAQWAFEAGPFRVEVKGTTFELEWQPAQEQLRLVMERGAVSVTGPLSAPINLTGHQTLVVDLQRREVKIRDGAVEPEASVAPTTPVSPGEAPSPGAVRSSTRSRPASSTAPSASWANLLAAGRLDRILNEAEHGGIELVLAHRGSQDLAALADAARYKGQPELARRALIAQRRRFPGSVRATEAAFQIGRLTEDAGVGGAEQALDWYDRYLDEAPSGPYAAEVLGRKMAVLHKLHGRLRARPVAEEYLRRFPEGAYAELARRLAAP